jgi:hypothetical protein
MNADTRAQTRPTASLMHNVNTASQSNGHGSTYENGNRGQRPGTNVSRTFSQGRVSTDISHIDAMPRDLPDPASQGKPLPTVQDIEQTDQDEQEDQEQTNVVVPPPPMDNSQDAPGSSSSPTPRQQQQMLEQQEQRQNEPQAISSPGLLGLASFVYRSASFSSLASAFGLSGSDPEPSQHYGMILTCGEVEWWC